MAGSGEKILIITYYWPPCGGAGVQRWLKFSKYLPEFGWKLFILTVDQDYAEYPAIDESLEKDINPSVNVYKTPAVNYFRILKERRKITASAGFASGKDSIWGKIARFVRGNFFIPDPRMGWNKYAVTKAIHIIQEEGIKYVVTTSPPHSTQLIGLRLKKLLPKIFWISDLRDPWTEIYYYKKFYGTLPARIKDRKLEKKVLLKADKIITVGKNLAGLLKVKVPGRAQDIKVITNGYDDEDFNDIASTNDDFNITYTGTISDQYPVNTFMKAVNELYLSDDVPSLKVRFIGQVPEKVKTDIASYPVSTAVEFIPYSNHKDSVNFILESNMLLLLIPDYTMNEIIITGKIFEYIRSGRPVLCIGPVKGDAASIITQMEAGKIFEPGNIKGIKDYIISCLNRDVKLPHNNKYSHYNIARQLSEYLKNIDKINIS